MKNLLIGMLIVTSVFAEENTVVGSPSKINNVDSTLLINQVDLHGENSGTGGRGKVQLIRRISLEALGIGGPGGTKPEVAGEVGGNTVAKDNIRSAPIVIRHYPDQMIKLDGVRGIKYFSEYREDSVELISRYHEDGDYITGSYSFFHNTRDDVSLTRNNWDLYLVAGEDYGENYLSAGGVGKILDLGKMSCADIENNYEHDGSGREGFPLYEDRWERPMFWLRYSNAFHRLRNEPTATVATVNNGHCYLVDSVDSEQRVVAVFHVREHIENRSVVIDEIEVFGRYELRPIN